MHRNTRFVGFMLLLALASVFVLVGLSGNVAASEQGGDHQLALPLSVMTGRIGKQTSVIGGVLEPASLADSVYTASQGGITWTRYDLYRWDAVESTEGERNWAAAADAETSLAQMSAAGLSPVLVIGGTPTWAQAVPDSSCGPVSADKLEAFGDFMFDLVERYSQPPYNVTHYEFYDKPDVDPSLVAEDSDFGCWGDSDDTEYYGGDVYGSMLAAVYPRIKAANPNAQVLTGGLILECDYTRTYDPTRDCTPSKFLSGILSTGANAFDIVTYQAYGVRTAGRLDWDREYPLWDHRGGLVLGKMDFVEEEFAAAGVTMKPVFVTEAALTCFMEGGCESNAAELQADQANYAVRMYTRAQANGLAAVLWSTYSGPGWRDTGILDGSQNPRPAYKTFQLLGRILSTATFSDSTVTADMESYTFTQGSTSYTFYFSMSDAEQSVPLPAGNVQLFDQYGTPLPMPNDNTIMVGFEPILVQVN